MDETISKGMDGGSTIQNLVYKLLITAAIIYLFFF
jgi:hypothetical protein